jgi:hypothetical protein
MAINGFHDEKDESWEAVKSALLTGLEERDHEKPEMAALNFKQYKYQRNQIVKSTGSKRSDSHLQVGELEDKVSDQLAKYFDGKDLGVLPADDPDSRVTVEAWKKDALLVLQGLPGQCRLDSLWF